MNIVEYAGRDALMTEVAKTLASELETYLSNHDQASLAVPGGTTPGPIFDKLSAADLDWSRVNILPTDERWVAADDPRSNERLIRERLMVNKAQAATFVPLYQAGSNPEDAIPTVSSRLDACTPISLLVLGMGADMHTASLFPGASGLDLALDPNAPAVAVLRPDSQPEARISLSAPVLATAVTTHLVVTGADKRDALEKAQNLPVETAPVRVVLDNATIHWAE